LKETSVGAIVYQIHDQKIEYLLIHQRHGNHIGFPKGHIEFGESYEQTAIREVFEETGIHCKILNEKFQIHYAPKPGIEKEVIYYAAAYQSGNIQIQASEIIDAYFKRFEDAYEQLTYDNDKQILKTIHTILRKKALSS
jgi:bis(5'-nucleosidyl)-tetraphosphatase